MALPIHGLYDTSNSAAGNPGAGYYYPHGQGSYMYAGTFFIDTGYDDPVFWNQTGDVAELYQARVYGSSGNIQPSVGENNFTNDWMIAPTVVWAGRFFQAPAAVQYSQRILIKCDAYAGPQTNHTLEWIRLNTVRWSLYRV